jgi:hypothetical protein
MRQYKWFLVLALIAYCLILGYAVMEWLGVVAELSLWAFALWLTVGKKR